MNVFLDFGGNKAQGLKSFISKYNIDKSWIIETFEPDPNCMIEEHVPNLENLIVNKKAIWTHTGTVNFSQMIENTEGSSVECLMSEGVCSDPESESFRKHDSIITVDCVDISEVLSKYSNVDFLVVKMDIEGSEFQVLRKAIQDNSIQSIDHLYVEWHWPFVKGESIDTVNDLKSKLTKLNIQHFDWH